MPKRLAKRLVSVEWSIMGAQLAAATTVTPGIARRRGATCCSKTLARLRRIECQRDLRRQHAARVEAGLFVKQEGETAIQHSGARDHNERQRDFDGDNGAAEPRAAVDPVIRPRGAFARIREENPDGRRAPKTLARQLDITVEELRAAVIPAERQNMVLPRPIVHFEGHRQAQDFSVRHSFAGKHVMLIGVTGFIGKVWLANTLLDLPEVERSLPADSPSEVEPGGAPLREDGRRFSRI